MTMSRAAIVAAARCWIGTPYAHQSSLIGVGCDCLGLVRGVWREFFADEPEPIAPYAPVWPLASKEEHLWLAATRHLEEINRENSQPGDVLLFRWRHHLPASHLAIISAGNLMIHAHDGACVAEVAISPWWKRHIAAAFSFPGLKQ